MHYSKLPIVDSIESQDIDRESISVPTWRQWLEAIRKVWPFYLASHLAFVLLTYLAVLFKLNNFSGNTLHTEILLQLWNHSDTAHFIIIATNGYDGPWRTAFFPLYPLLMKGLAFLVFSPYIAGLIISNLAGLLLFTVLYRLVSLDFDGETATRTVLYLSLFPTAFFLAAAYNESLFLCLVLLSFYHIRQGHWWLAGLFGLLASLTRSAGLLLLIPFYYEYVRQQGLYLWLTDKASSVARKRCSILIKGLAGLAIPAGTGLFALYCAYRFHDPLAFFHAQQTGWTRSLAAPWTGLLDSVQLILQQGLLNFGSIHNVIDLSASVLMILLTIFCFVGPWKLARSSWVYGWYAGAVALFLLLFPVTRLFPLQSVSRLVLEIFPIFIVLARIGKQQTCQIYYLMLSVAVLCCLLLQFLTGGWIV